MEQSNTENGRRPLLVEQRMRIKTYDIDFVGHVNNIVYVRWLEDLRLALLDAYLPLESLRAENTLPIIVETSIVYRQAIALSDHEVLARMWVTDLERATIHLEAEFLVGDDTRCTARQRGTFVDTAKMRPVRIPEAMRAQFEAGR